MLIDEMPPRQSNYEESVAAGMALFGLVEIPSDADEIAEEIGKIDELLRNVPYPKGNVEAQSIKERYLSAVGIVYGMLLAKATNWQYCWTRMPGERPSDGIDSVVSPSRSHLIYPIGVVYREAGRHNFETREMYERVISGELPEPPPNAYLELRPDGTSVVIHLPPPAGDTGEEIAKLEDLMGVKIPQDFAIFLERHFEEHPSRANYWLKYPPKREWIESVDATFPIGRIVEEIRKDLALRAEGKAFHPSQMFPIARNGSGDCIYLSLREDEKGSIYFRFDEPGGGPEEELYRIGVSFTEWWMSLEDLSDEE